jgi:hypothetical protein
MKKRRLINIIIILIAIIAIGFGGFFYYKLHKMQRSYVENQKQQKAEQALKDKNDLITNVGKLYLFPIDEMPTIATVSDPGLVKTQNFFTNPEAGDKVLIFTNSTKAVLYRPSINKIIDIVSVSSGSFINIDNSNIPNKKN